MSYDLGRIRLVINLRAPHLRVFTKRQSGVASHFCPYIGWNSSMIMGDTPRMTH